MHSHSNSPRCDAKQTQKFEKAKMPHRLCQFCTRTRKHAPAANTYIGTGTAFPETASVPKPTRHDDPNSDLSPGMGSLQTANEYARRCTPSQASCSPAVKCTAKARMSQATSTDQTAAAATDPLWASALGAAWGGALAVRAPNSAAIRGNPAAQRTAALFCISQ